MISKSTQRHISQYLAEAAALETLAAKGSHDKSTPEQLREAAKHLRQSAENIKRLDAIWN